MFIKLNWYSAAVVYYMLMCICKQQQVCSGPVSQVVWSLIDSVVEPQS